MANFIYKLIQFDILFNPLGIYQLQAFLRGPDKRGVWRIIERIFLISQQKICCDPSLEPSRRDGSNDVSQHTF